MSLLIDSSTSTLKNFQHVYTQTLYRKQTLPEVQSVPKTRSSLGNRSDSTAAVTWSSQNVATGHLWQVINMALTKPDDLNSI